MILVQSDIGLPNLEHIQLQLYIKNPKATQMLSKNCINELVFFFFFF